MPAVYNPFRYRGYYYDTETGLYYLQSRYYNPAWGRFLNADGYINANGDLTGYNMYAYCSNNPIMYVDPTGQAWWHWALAATIVVACAVATVVTCGGFAAAATAVALVASGTAAATAASTIAASAFIASATALGVAALDAVMYSSSVDECINQGNWGTVGFVAFSAAYGGYLGYGIYTHNNPSAIQNPSSDGENGEVTQNRFNLNGSKGESYVKKRGWTTDSINAAINNGRMGTSINKANGQPCTVYCYPGTKSYVVIEDGTGSLVQASQFGDPDWYPDGSIIWDP